MPGIRKLATRVTNLPVRIAKPEKMVGLTDQISSPAFATSVGLLNWAILMSEASQEVSDRSGRKSKPLGINTENIRKWLKRVLP